MHHRAARAILYILLVFQLAVGMELPVAQAASSSSVSRAAHTADAAGEPCPEHMGNVATHAVKIRAGIALVPSSEQKPLAKHDCCRSLGCQCHCTYTPAVPGELGLSNRVVSPYLLPAFEARLAAARVQEFFRPPIR